ncbi:DUF2851 family protein [Flavobacteriaceae bacterium F08102]|nr:DUF2851 family protein [Flavobacteriaceae bacterium F08102]
MIKEDFLHYIWKLQQFSPEDLRSSEGTPIEVIKPGIHNHNAGPDFFNAKLRIGSLLWVGNVEIHIQSSDWFAHGHETDPNYDNVILHVVWEHNMTIFSANEYQIPTLILSAYTPEDILKNYTHLIGGKHRWMHCENQLHKVDKRLIHLCVERMFVERLEQKTIRIFRRLTLLNNDWEALLFEILSRNFGLIVNADAFESLAQQLSFNGVRKVWGNRLQLEALLYGQAGMLSENHQIPYYQKLQREYAYLYTKLKLSSGGLIRFQFFRLRPHNFPTLRIAQLASLYHKEQNLFSKLMEITDIKAYYSLFDIEVSTFWKTHFSFHTSAKESPKKLAPSFIDLILINTVIPLKYLYLNSLGQYNSEILIEMMKQLKAERNAILDKFIDLGISPSNALESQGLLQLRTKYCEAKACLNCPIGTKVINLKTGREG